MTKIECLCLFIEFAQCDIYQIGVENHMNNSQRADLIHRIQYKVNVSSVLLVFTVILIIIAFIVLSRKREAIARLFK